MQFPLPVLRLLLTSALSQITPVHAVFFSNDAETRRPATPAESQWTVQLPYCTGVALTDRLILTAAHCYSRDGLITHPFIGQIGWDSLKNRSFVIQKMVDQSPSAQGDFGIFEVYWFGGTPPATLHFVPEIALHPPVGTSALSYGYSSGEAHALMTSTGKIRALEAIPGQAVQKQPNERFLRFDLGVSHGSSGAPIFDVNHKLLGIVTGGPSPQSGIPNTGNSPDNTAAWNWGPSTALIRHKSPVFSSLFNELGQSKFNLNSGNSPVTTPALNTPAAEDLNATWIAHSSGILTTQDHWIFPHCNERKQTYFAAIEHCRSQGEGWSLPTYAELENAAVHGIFKPENNPSWGHSLSLFVDRLWLHSERPLEPYPVADLTDGEEQEVYNPQATANFVCIKKHL